MDKRRTSHPVARIVAGFFQGRDINTVALVFRVWVAVSSRFNMGSQSLKP